MGDPIDQRITAGRVYNWANTYQCTPSQFLEPSTVEEVQDAVRRASAEKRHIRVVGSAHSPNACAMSSDIVMSLKRLHAVLSIQRVEEGEGRGTAIVTAEAGLRLEDLHPILDSHGLALPNLGSISEQSLAGMISTGTHGTGKGSGCMATTITQLQLVTAAGELLTCSRSQNAALFKAALCSLGVLGVIVRLSFRAVPAFDLSTRQTPTTLSAILGDGEGQQGGAQLADRVGSATFYRFWWWPHTDCAIEWRAEPVEPVIHRSHPSGPWARAKEWVLGTLLGFHGLQAALAVNHACTGLGLPSLVPLINRAWFTLCYGGGETRSVDRSDRQFNINCLFKQHVDEWAVPVDALPHALRELRAALGPGLSTSSSCIHPRGGAHFPVEVRFTAGDDIWLSPSYGRATAWVGIIQYKPWGLDDPVGYKAYFAAFESIMARYGGRPHWAKDFGWSTSPPSASPFEQAYPMWGRFLALRAALDPRGLFLNPWAKRVLGGGGVGPPALALAYEAAQGGEGEEGGHERAARQGEEGEEGEGGHERVARQAAGVLQTERGDARAVGLIRAGLLSSPSQEEQHEGSRGEGRGEPASGPVSPQQEAAETPLAASVGFVLCGLGYVGAAGPALSATCTPAAAAPPPPLRMRPAAAA